MAEPVHALAAQPVVFRYGVSISDPPASNSQLGFPVTPGTLPLWAVVTFSDSETSPEMGIADDHFLMEINALFDPVDGGSPSLTQLAFNLLGDYSADASAKASADADMFQVVGCSSVNPDSTLCDALAKGRISASYASNGMNVDGLSLKKQAFDFLLELPPPGEPKLDVGQSPIVLDIAAPAGFSVQAFKACSNDETFDAIKGCSGGAYETVAKVQELRGSPNSTIISGSDPPPLNGEPVPGPLPILGAASAFSLSRRLRQRLAQVRR